MALKITPFVALLVYVNGMAVTPLVHANSLFSEEKSKVGGYFQVLVGQHDREGHSSAIERNSEISDMQSNSPLFSENFVTFYGEINYRFEKTNTTLFLASPDESLGKFVYPLEAGIRHTTANDGEFSFSYVPKLSGGYAGEAWRDPYRTSAPRVKTDIELEALRFSALYILGAPFSFYYERGRQNVTDDHAGESQSHLSAAALNQLKRSGQFSLTSVSVTIPLASGLYVIPEYGYLAFNANGDANQYRSNSLGVTLYYKAGPYELYSVYKHFDTDYHATHPVFSKKRQQNEEMIVLGANYHEPFDWKDTSLDFLVSASEEKSNIAFYDSRQTVFMTGLTVRY